MQSHNRFFDDLAKILNGAAGTFAGMGRETEANVRERFREFVGGTDFVSRDEFNAVKHMAAAARAEVDLLKARLDALETGPMAPRTATRAPATAQAPARKTAPQRTAAPRKKAAAKSSASGSSPARSAPSKK